MLGFVVFMVVIKSLWSPPNQLVALEGIISVKYPLFTGSVFSLPCFRIFYILAFLCIIIGQIVLHPLLFISCCTCVDCVSGHMGNILWIFMLC